MRSSYAWLDPVLMLAIANLRHCCQRALRKNKLSPGFLRLTADLGYGVVSREDNLPYGIGCCAEFTFVKVERPATC